MKKWLFIFCLCLPTFFLMGAIKSWDAYKKFVLAHQKTIPGWCVPEKAGKMMDLIYEIRPQVCVEIGVYGGSSVYPTAAALAFVRNGIIHAIDPWKEDECLIGYDANNPNYDWWKNHSHLEAIYQMFLVTMHKHKLNRYCHVMRMTSVAALSHFADESVDILHIDGNHTENVAFSDAEMWLPKVRSGGFIWFDDVNWSTTKKAVQFMLKNCIFLPDRSIGNECYLFQKN